MKKSLKTIQIADAYQLIEGANYQALSNEDKVKLWKISRVLKPTATQFLSDKSDAIKKFVTQEFWETFKKVKAYDDKKAVNGELPMTAEEYKDCCKTLDETNTLMEEAIGEFADKEVELEFEPVSELALGILVTSNSWEFSKTEYLEWLMEEK